MTAPDSLAAIRERAIRSDRAAWLSAPVEDLSTSIDDAELAAIARFVSEKLSLRTIDGLLGSADAERAFRKALAPAIRLRLYEALEASVRGATSNPTRMAVRDEPSRVGEPPRVAVQLVAWAREHGIEDRLDRPASVVLAFAESGAHLAKHPFDAAATVHDVVHRRRLPTSGASASTLTEAARAYLLHEAMRRSDEKARSERWEKPPASLALRRIAAILRKAHEEAAMRAPLDRPVIERLRHVELDVGARQLLARFSPPTRAESKSDVTARVSLGADAGHSACDCATFRTTSVCAHVERALAETLDILSMPKHPLHEAVTATLDSPEWKTLEDAVDRATAKADPPPERRVAFRLDPDDERAPVKALIRRRHKDGGFSAGAQVAFDRAPLDATTIAADELALLSLGMAMESHDAAPRFRGALLHALARYGEVVDPDDPKRTVPVCERSIALALDLEDDGARVRFKLGTGPIEAEGLVRASTVVRWNGDARAYDVADVDPRLVPIADAVTKLEAAMPRLAAEALVDRLVSLQPGVPILLPEALAGRRVAGDPRLSVQLSPLGDGGVHARIAVRPLPEGPSFAPGDGPSLLVGVVAGERVHVTREPAHELEQAHQLSATLDLESGTDVAPHAARFDTLESALALLERISRLGDAVRVEWPKGASPYRVVTAKSTSASVRVRTAARWLGVEGELDTGEGKIALAPLLRAIRDGKRYVALGGGAFLRIEDALRERLSASADAMFESEDGLALAHANALVLESLADAGSLDLDAKVRSMADRVAEARALVPTLGPALEPILRTYQTEGFVWMSRLSAMGFGGLLADEMGLGKTLQSLALLSSRAELGPALVVTPTSVADGWANEARKFTPELRAEVHIGQRRAVSFEKLRGGDVLVTSYDVLARDAEMLSKVPFATAIFDEAHMLKNARTRRSEAARSIQASARIALTGTPIENHLGDLFGIFDVISPGLLGSWAHFRDRYATPIERHGDASRRKALRDLVMPYVLRRTKADVAIELPERLEVEHAIDLSAEESLLYEASRREAIADLTKPDGSLTQRRFAVLAAITRLRQLACHPRLVDPSSAVSSSKLTAFLEMAHDLVREGHRTLVFSQFTRHLDLIREALDGAGYESLRLDGSTPARDRSRLVDTFQKGQTPFFLISLKAGGTGLNLTAADYVIHLDPWWNPAVEDQASDRAHRLGQTQPVTIVRLVANDTIERSVLRLHAEKRSLADALLAESNKIGRTELEDLVALITG